MNTQIMPIGKPVATVYETYAYDAFRKMPENRIVDNVRLDKLKASFSEHEVLNPIIVNEDYEICDGQGRYETLKSLGRPIKYILIPGLTIEDCRRLNHYNFRWTIGTFVDSYSRSSNKELAETYGRIKQASLKHNAPYSRIFRLINKSRNFSDKVMNGTITFTEEDLALFELLTREANEILTALCFDGRTNEAFWHSISVIHGTQGYDHRKMIQQCEACRGSYAQMASLADQLVEFSRIYNYRTTPRKKLYFEDYMRHRRNKNSSDYSKDITHIYSRRNDLEDASSLKEVKA